MESKELRHYIAVLVQANKWRRDLNVPSIYKMPNPQVLGNAIDVAVSLLKELADVMEMSEKESARFNLDDVDPNHLVHTHKATMEPGKDIKVMKR